MKALRDPNGRKTGELPEYDCGNAKCRFSRLNPANSTEDDGYITSGSEDPMFEGEFEEAARLNGSK